MFRLVHFLVFLPLLLFLFPVSISIYHVQVCWLCYCFGVLVWHTIHWVHVYPLILTLNLMLTGDCCYISYTNSSLCNFTYPYEFILVSTFVTILLTCPCSIIHQICQVLCIRVSWLMWHVFLNFAKIPNAGYSRFPERQISTRSETTEDVSPEVKPWQAKEMWRKLGDLDTEIWVSTVLA